MYINNDNLEVENSSITEFFTSASTTEVPEELPSEIGYEPRPDPDMLPRKAVELSPELALPRIRAHIDLGSPVRLTVTGNSMQPFLYDRRNSVILAPLKRKPRVGDIVFYTRSESIPVLHRIIEIPESGSIICCGDAQITPERISRDSIIAVVTDIENRGSYFSCGSVSWKLKSRVWMWLRPVRPRLLRAISAVRRFFNR